MYLASTDLAIVRCILAEHLPPDITVMAYGSRAHGRNLKPFSYLDLALAAHGRPVKFALLGRLRQAFEDSDLPFRVDVIDLERCDPSFRALIAGDLVHLSSRSLADFGRDRVARA